jgi:probable addiction module antidote protein
MATALHCFLIARVKGISSMAKEVGITRQGLQKALSSKSNPRLDNINAILQAMGYGLVPQKLDTHTHTQTHLKT